MEVAVFRCHAPIQIIYWTLADELARGRVERCADPTCRMPFLMHERQEFCSPTHANRARQRKHARRKRQRGRRAT